MQSSIAPFVAIAWIHNKLRPKGFNTMMEWRLNDHFPRIWFVSITALIRTGHESWGWVRGLTHRKVDFNEAPQVFETFLASDFKTFEKSLPSLWKLISWEYYILWLVFISYKELIINLMGFLNSFTSYYANNLLEFSHSLRLISFGVWKKPFLTLQIFEDAWTYMRSSIQDQFIISLFQAKLAGRKEMCCLD